MELPPGTALFISEFHLDKQRPKDERRASWKVEGASAGDVHVYKVTFFVDGEKLDTHIYKEGCTESASSWLSEFLKELVGDWMGIKAKGLPEEEPPEPPLDWPNDR